LVDDAFCAKAVFIAACISAGVDGTYLLIPVTV
jgi:hypothetical protein